MLHCEHFCHTSTFKGGMLQSGGLLDFFTGGSLQVPSLAIYVANLVLPTALVIYWQPFFPRRFGGFC